MAKIVGKNDGPGGRNEHYQIGRRTVTRTQAVREVEVESGQHPDAHVIKVNGRKYVRDNPDSSTADNVNRNRR